MATCHRAIHAAVIPSNLSGELGEVISGRTSGRTSDDDITIAKLVGIGAQDLVAAEVTLAKLSPAGATLATCST